MFVGILANLSYISRTMASYYDVNAILTDAEKVPCTFNLDLPGLGFLDENPGEDV